jgi:hypothetical protein
MYYIDTCRCKYNYSVIPTNVAFQNSTLKEKISRAG